MGWMVQQNSKGDFCSGARRDNFANGKTNYHNKKEKELEPKRYKNKSLKKFMLLLVDRPTQLVCIWTNIKDIAG